MEHADEGGLARPVLAQHDQDLAVCELASFYVEREASLRPGHGRVRVAAELLRAALHLCGCLRHLRRSEMTIDPCSEAA